MKSSATDSPGTSFSARLARVPDRLSDVKPWVIDAVMTAVFVAVGLLTTSGDGAYEPGVVRSRDVVGVILVLLSTVPYVFRRRAPLAVLVVSGLAVATLALVPYNEGAVPTVLWFGMYAVGSWCSARKGALGLAFVTTLLLVIWIADRTAGSQQLDLGSFLVNLAAFAASFFFGTAIRSRRERLAALEDRAVALEHEHAEKQARVLADERLRIAHELHDVIAHSMGVIAVQAGVGAHVIDSNPAEAKKALTAISDVSRSTLAEIRRILAALRQEDGAPDGLAGHAPAPTLADLDRLVTDMRGAGLQVELVDDCSAAAAPEEVPHGIELAAYRIVQEALTNSLKHAGPARATVHIDHQPGVLHLVIADDGRGVNARSNGGGHGLIGMRERVSAYGGSFSAGPSAGGGFKVEASLPYGSDG